MSNAKELEALVKRLEAVTTRLENVNGGGPAVQSAISNLRQATSSKSLNIKALNDAINFLENQQGGISSGCLDEFDDILNSHFKVFLEASRSIGGDVSTQSEMVDGAIKAQRAFLVSTFKFKKPEKDAIMEELLKPTSQKISEVISFREANRRSEYFNHLSAISESIPALGWVTVSPAPSPFVKEMNDAGQFYTNRVLRDFKGKSPRHAEWVKAWISLISELQSFVKKNYTTGLTWNSKGEVASCSAPSGAPLPPPPPPPGLFDDINNDKKPEKTQRSALLDELNKGEDITKGLKKVTSDMQNHKNPSLRSSDAPTKTSTKSNPKQFGGGFTVPPNSNKPPKFELDGKKWIVEYQKGNSGLTVRDGEVNQSVYVYRCEGCTLKVNDKVNNIILDSCKKMALVFDSVVSSCEFINCQSVQMQVMKKVPTISIDKTDGCQMYLSKESSDVVIVSAKSSEMNVLISNGEDYVEQPVPEQFKTCIKGTKLSTVPTESV